jgi:copper chaperone CopZ
MRKRQMLLTAALALGVMAPGMAAPMMKSTVGHMCCGLCENSIKEKIALLPWAGEIKTDRAAQSVTLQAKEGAPIDVVALVQTMQATGFPPTLLELTGAKALKMDVGHLCCAGCVGPLKAALGKVGWVAAAEVAANSPVTLTVKPGATANLTELMDVMKQAGYSAVKLSVTS